MSVASASSAIGAISTACRHANICEPRVVTSDRAGVKEVEKRLHVGWHCYCRPVLERRGNPIGYYQSELALAARTGSGCLRGPVRRSPTGAAEYGVNRLCRERIWHIQSYVSERGCY